MASRLVSSVAALLLMACQPDASSLAEGGLRGLGEAVLVFSSEPSWTDREAWSVDSVPLLAIGSLDGDVELQFSDISAASRQSDGDVVVADVRSGTVRLYDGRGQVKKTLGGPGSGPGEFRTPTQLVLAGDSILVWDEAAWRLSHFDPEGDLVGVRGVDPGEVARAVDPPLYPMSAKLVDRNALVVRLVTKAKIAPSESPYRLPSGALVVSLDETQEQLRLDFDDVEQVIVDSPWGPLPVTPPLATSTTMTVLPERGDLCVADQAVSEIVCIDPRGNSIRIGWSAEPKPLPADAQEVLAWREETTEAYAQKLSADDIRRLLARVPVAAYRPPHSGVVIDALGNLWVEVGPSSSQLGRGTDHLVFSSAGSLLGAVSAPVSQILEVGDDYLLGVHVDDFGVEYLWLMRLEKPASS